jgi:hypothetical protein
MKTSYYTNPPPAFLPGSCCAPVPGWGINPAIVGPARVGVGTLPPGELKLVQDLNACERQKADYKRGQTIFAAVAVVASVVASVYIAKSLR